MTSSQSLVFCFCEEGLISRFILLLFNRLWFVGLTKSASTYKAVSNHHSAALFTLFSKKTWPPFCSSDTRFQAVFTQGSRGPTFNGLLSLEKGPCSLGSFHSGFKSQSPLGAIFTLVLENFFDPKFVG